MSFKLYFPSLAITVHNQIDDYTTNQFVSELGGAAGIVLGVSLYTIVKCEIASNNSFEKKNDFVFSD